MVVFADSESGTSGSCAEARSATGSIPTQISSIGSCSTSSTANEQAMSPTVQQMRLLHSSISRRRGCTSLKGIRVVPSLPALPCTRLKHGPHTNCIPSQLECTLHYSHNIGGVCDGCGFSGASSAGATTAAHPFSQRLPVRVRSFLDEADAMHAPAGDEGKQLRWAPCAKQGALA